MDTEETFFLALKMHRESKGIEIDEISDYTKINPKYLNAIEEGDFNIIPNIYMRLFIRSYAKYIDADFKQALVDYELHTTGKIQPKFFENEDDKIDERKTTSANTPDFGDEFQINYKQVITIILTAIAIYFGFKLVEYISNDNVSSNSNIIPSTSSSESKLQKFDTLAIDEDNISDLSLLSNKDFKNSLLAYEITEIIPTSLNQASLKIKTLSRTKINASTYHEDGSIFF